MLLVMGCTRSADTVTATATATAIATPVPSRSSQAAQLTPLAPTPTALARPAPTPTPPAASVQTFHAQISFDTYETEETVQSQLGRLPGVSSVAVTQLDVTVQYDSTRLTADDILRTLRANPEVRIKDETRAEP